MVGEESGLGFVLVGCKLMEYYFVNEGLWLRCVHWRRRKLIDNVGRGPTLRKLSPVSA
jgi:hypothetical protein